MERKKINWLNAGPYIALAVLLIVCCISSDSFRQWRNLVNICRQVSYSGIIAVGMTLVIIAGGIDLAVGSLLAISGVTAVMVMNQFVDPATGLALGMLAALGVGLAGGALNGLLITAGRIPPFIVTLGTMSIFRSIALYAANAGLVSSRNEYFRKLGSAVLAGIPLPVWVLGAVAIIYALLLERTGYGRHLCAVGANENVARYSAIKVNKVKFITYVLTGSTVAISAILLGGRLSSVSSTNAGLSYELDAIAAVIIGGTSMSGGRGSVRGTIAGILILGIVSNVLDMWGISVNLQGAVKGAVIIGAVLIQRKK